METPQQHRSSGAALQEKQGELRAEQQENRNGHELGPWPWSGKGSEELGGDGGHDGGGTGSHAGGARDDAVVVAASDRSFMTATHCVIN